MFPYVVLVDETKRGVDAKLKMWREALESKGFKISGTKTEYMKCNLRKIRSRSSEVRIENQY